MAKKIMLDFSKATEEKEKNMAVDKTHKNDDKLQQNDDKPKKVYHKRKFTPEQIASRRYRKSDVVTHEGHRLNIREAKFIDEYIASGNQRQSVIRAGYDCGKDEGFAGQVANRLLGRAYIADEIQYRMEQHKSEKIADRDEIMQFFTDMMRGKILDQFDLPTTNGDKIKAACELAKRSIDFEDRLKEKRTQTTAPEVKISLKWEGRDEEQK